MKQTSSTPLEQADGNILPECGSSKLNLQLGELKLKKEVTIAHISDDALIGMDFGSMDVLSSNSTVIIDQHEIPVTIVPPYSTRQVRLSEDVTIPGFTESIVNVEMKEKIPGNNGEQCIIIEPKSNFVETYSALMANSLVTRTSDKSTRVRIMNPGVTPIELRKGACVGTYEPCEIDIRQVVDMEDEKEETNSESMKRLKFRKGIKSNALTGNYGQKETNIANATDTVRQISQQSSTDISAPSTAQTSEIVSTNPSHIRDMFQTADSFEHLYRPRRIFERLKTANVKLKPEKCELVNQKLFVSVTLSTSLASTAKCRHFKDPPVESTNNNDRI